MAQITLQRAQVMELFNFCVDNDKKDFFVAKDQGAYIGANAGKGETFKNCIFYFPGCDPKKDEDWWETCSDKFGGDDFGEMLPLDWLKKVADDTDIVRMTIKVLKTRIAAEYFKKKKA